MWRALLSCHGVLNGQQVKNLNGKGASGVRAAVPFQDGDDDGIGWGVVEWSRGDCRDGTGEPARSRQPIEAAGRNQMGLVKLGPGSWPPWPSDEATNGPSRADASSQLAGAQHSQQLRSQGHICQPRPFIKNTRSRQTTRGTSKSATYN